LAETSAFSAPPPVRENEGDLGPKGRGRKEKKRKRKRRKEKDCTLEIPFNSRCRLIPQDMSVEQDKSCPSIIRIQPFFAGTKGRGFYIKIILLIVM
jgi:hypothetical protein